MGLYVVHLKMEAQTYTPWPFTKVCRLHYAASDKMVFNSCKSMKEGQQDGPEDRGPCCRVLGPEFNPWNLCGGRREPRPTSCPLTATPALCHTCTQTDKCVFKFLKMEEFYLYSVEQETANSLGLCAFLRLPSTFPFLGMLSPLCFGHGLTL